MQIRLATVRTVNGRKLAATRTDAPDSMRLAAEHDPSPDNTVIACIPHQASHHAFLMLPNAESITIRDDGFAGPIISFRLVALIDPGLFELRHPVARQRCIGVAPDMPGFASGRVFFTGVGNPNMDRFRLGDADSSMLSDAGQALLAEISAVIEPPLDAERLLHAMASGALRPSAAEGLIRLLPFDQMDIVARRALESPPALKLLQRAMPGDPWISGALPDLIAWRDGGRKMTRTAVSKRDEAHLSVPQSGNLRPQAGLMLQSLARKSISPRRVCAILAIMKNEGPYLLDWLAHHRSIGFEHFFIYTNDNTDGSDELLGLLAQHGLISWINNELNPEETAQIKAYGHALKRLPDTLDFRWTMILDADEYLGLDRSMFPSVQDYIAWQERLRVDAIALRWLIFAAKAEDVWDDVSSLQRFTWREPGVSQLFKTLCRTNLFFDSHAHFPFPTADQPFAYRWEDGTVSHHMAKLDRLAFADPPPTARFAWVAHYLLRSATETLFKLGRRDGWFSRADETDSARSDRLIKKFLELAGNPALAEDRRMLAFGQEYAAELARIRSLPGIAACDTQIKHQFRETLARLATAAADAVNAADAPAHYKTFSQIIRSQQ